MVTGRRLPEWSPVMSQLITLEPQFPSGFCGTRPATEHVGRTPRATAVVWLVFDRPLPFDKSLSRYGHAQVMFTRMERGDKQPMTC